MPGRASDPPLPEDLVELLAGRLATLGDPVRVRLLDTLRRSDEASVGELAEAAGAGYANAAKHLALLHRERVLSRRKEGARVIYRICDPTVLAICELVCESLAAQVRELDALIGAVHTVEPAATPRPSKPATPRPSKPATPRRQEPVPATTEVTR